MVIVNKISGFVNNFDRKALFLLVIRVIFHESDMGKCHSNCIPLSNSFVPILFFPAS